MSSQASYDLLEKSRDHKFNVATSQSEKLLVTEKSKRRAIKRKNETPEERERRNAKAREYKARWKETETPEQKERRRARNRENMARKIKNETPEEKEFRLAAIREKNARRRQMETPEQKAERRARKALSQRKYERKIALERKESRLTAKRERYARKRRKEQSVERRACKSLSPQCVTVENRDTGESVGSQSSQVTIKTENEIFEEEETQLTETIMTSSYVLDIPGKLKTETAKQSDKLLARETPERREIRLMKFRQYNAFRRKNETPEEREKRIVHLREYRARRKQTETPEQREKRRAKDRELKAQILKKETLEERNIRLAAIRERNSRRREMETPEQRAERRARKAFHQRKYVENRLTGIRKRYTRKRQTEQKAEGRACKSLSQRKDLHDKREKLDSQNNQVTIKTEKEIFEEEKTQITDTRNKLKTEKATQIEEQLTKAQEILEDPEIDQKCFLTDNLSTLQREDEKLEKMDSKLLIASQVATTSLEIVRDVKHEPLSLPIILINDEKKTIIVDIKKS